MNKQIIPIERIEQTILELRDQKVIIDSDLATIYGTTTKRLNEQVRRNINRFPKDFMFELSKVEYESLRSQFATSKRGGTRYLPFAFTEQGVAMLSSVLRSQKAIDVNISIVRAFVIYRQNLNNYQQIKEQIEKLEQEMNLKFNDIHQALNYLLQKDEQEIEQKERKRIGFKK